MSDGKGSIPPMNPYGGVGGGGITLPPYYKPTEDMGSGSTYYPTSEELGKDEMRITFVGSCPFPPRRNQAATCIMVELGNGKRFFFDFGPGCLRNILAMQVPLQMVNDIFLTHLHVDHYGELPYLFAFAPWAARWKPLRVHGPWKASQLFSRLFQYATALVGPQICNSPTCPCATEWPSSPRILSS